MISAPSPECLSPPVPPGRVAEAELASFIAHLWELLPASLTAHRHLAETLQELRAPVAMLALCARRAEHERMHQRRAMAFEELGQAIASTERLVRQMEALALRDLETAGSFSGLPRP